VRSSRKILPLLALLLPLLLPSRGLAEEMRSDDAGHAALRILAGDDPPVTYNDGQGKIAGMGADLVRRVATHLGLPATIEIYPWGRAVSIAQTTPNILIVNAGMTAERLRAGFHFIGPIVTLRNALYRLKDSPIIVRSLADVAERGLLVGGTRGDKRVAALHDQGVPMFEVANHAQHVKMLLDGRVKLTLLSDLQMAMCLKLLDRDSGDAEPALQTDQQSNYLMFSPGTSPGLLAAWEKAIKDMRASGRFGAEAKKWSGVLGVKVDYDAERGYFIAASKRSPPGD
jgi:polar amino acid transport system substrate-binding protein